MTSTLARRIFMAHMELTYRLGRKVTLSEFGELIARQMRRDRPFTAAAVSRWETGTQIPGASIIEAIAKLTAMDPGWISHGEKSAAPAPLARHDDMDRKRDDRVAARIKVKLASRRRTT